MQTTSLQIIITAIDNASGVLAKTGNSLAKTGDKMKSVGKGMTMALTLPIVGVGIAATKMGLDFGKGIEYANTMLKLSGEELKLFKKGVLNLSDTYGKSASDIARAAYSVSSVLHTTGEETVVILDAIAAGAKAGKITTEQAGNAVIRMMSIYDIQAEDTMKLVDTLSATVKAGNANWQDMAQILPNVSGLAKPLGISLEEVAAAFAAVSAKAGSSAEAGTALRGVFTGLMKPSEEMKDAIKDMGYETAQSALESIGLKGVLAELGEKYGDNAEKIGELFPNIRGITGAVALFANRGGDLAESMDMVYDSVGETQKQIEAGQGSSESFTEALNEMRNAGIRLFETLEPYLTRLMNFLSGLTARFSALSPETKKFIVIAMGIVAAIGPLLIIGGTLLKSLSGLATGFKIAAFAVKGLAAAFTFLAANPIILVIMAIIAAGYLLYKNWDSIKDGLRIVWEALSSAAVAVFDGIVGYLQFWGEAIKLVFTTIGNFFKGVLIVWKEILRPIWQPVIEASKILFGFLTEWLGKVKDYVSDKWIAVGVALKEVWNSISIAFAAFIDPLKKAWETTCNWIVEKIQWVLDRINEIVGKLKAAVAPVTDLVKGAVGQVSEFGSAVGEKAGELGQSIWGGVTGLVGIGAGTEEYQTGGIVPGIGARLAVVHGGETIVPKGETMQTAATMPMINPKNEVLTKNEFVINITGNTFMSDEDVAEGIGDMIIDKLKSQMRL